MSRPLRTLLVEDTEDDVFLLVEALRKAGYEPEFERVQTGDALREALRRGNWELMLCDYIMPGFDAPAALRIVQEFNPELPVIVVSGMVGEDIAVQTIKLGAVDYLLKDRLARLGQAVGQALEQLKLRQERRQVAQALRESEEKFATIFREAPVWIVISDLASSVCLEVNATALQASGYRREEVVGRTGAELGWVKAKDREQLVQLLQAQGRVADLEMAFHTKDGRELCGLVSCGPILIGGRSCTLSVTIDITARKHAEHALRQSEDKFALAFRSSPHPLIISERATGRFVEVNRGFERMTGYTRDEVIGRSSHEMPIWENPADRSELIAVLERDGMARDRELRFRKKDGGLIITRCSFEGIELSGRACILSSMEDITERRRSEEQHLALEAQLRKNQKLEALGTLAGGIAHDFNNILTAIIVNQELALMDVTEPAAVQQRLAEIGRASNRAKELVRQILTFSRQQQQERLKQRLQPIILEALGLLRSSLPAMIEIVQDLSPEAPPVLADASQIHQVVMNLCTNAAHAMMQRSGRLTVQLKPRQLDAAACFALPGLPPGRYAQLTVADTGHGMEASVLARIFEPFFTTKGPGEGTGLGLPMVHGIMQDHDGGIFVQSSPGAGTTFELYFPEAMESGVPLATVNTEIVPGRGESVLVVDDEESICRAIGAMLRKIGYHVETFTDPRLALERSQGAPAAFNLLLTDRTMPQLSGPQLIARIRESCPGLPVLLMSGLGSPPDHEGGAEAVYQLVAKPIDIAELSRAVRQALLAKSIS